MIPQPVQRVLIWAPLVVVTVEAVLVISGWLGVAEAALALVVLEALLVAVVGTSAFTLLRSFRRHRSEDTDGWRIFQLALRDVLPQQVVVMVGHELGILRALWMSLRRRRDVPPGAAPLRYGRELRPLLAAVAVVSVVEIAVVAMVVDLIVPWPIVGWALLLVSVYGFFWLVGFRAALAAFPHLVGPRTLRLRFATLADLELPLELVESATTERNRGYRHTVNIDNGNLAVSVMGRANVKVGLRRPHPLQYKGAHREVTQVKFFADDPAGAVRRLLAARDAASGAAPPDGEATPSR